MFACALCSLYSPTAHVSVSFSQKENSVDTINLVWTFSENFSDLMVQNYDFNADRLLDDSELKAIRASLLDYLVPNEYLTKISYYYNADDEKQLNLKTRDYELFMQDGRLKFKIEFEADIALETGLVLSIEIFDSGGYFKFVFEDSKTHKLENNFYFIQNSNSNIAFLELTSQTKADEFSKRVSIKDIIKNPTEEYAGIDYIDDKEFGMISKISLGFLDRVKDIMRGSDNSAKAMFLIAVFSFVYGFMHAAGPGHAKSLTGSYFMANGGDIFRALKFALKVGFLHVFGSFVLVGFSFFALENIGIYTKQASYLTSLICGAIIVMISLFLLFRSFKNKKYKWSTHQNDCSCVGCKAMHSGTKSELGVTLAASIVPCPGVIMVFLLAFEAKGYLSGIISALFMGFGMSVVIFLAAVLGVKINKNLVKSEIFKYIQIIALALMCAIGIFMMINAKDGVF